MGVCMLPSLFQAISAFCCHKVKIVTLSCPPATMTFALSQAMAIEHVNQRLTGASERLSQNKYFLLKNRFPCVFVNCVKNWLLHISTVLILLLNLSFLNFNLLYPFWLLASILTTWLKHVPQLTSLFFFSPLLTSVHNMKLSYNSALKIC